MSRVDGDVQRQAEQGRDQQQGREDRELRGARCEVHRRSRGSRRRAAMDERPGSSVEEERRRAATSIDARAGRSRARATMAVRPLLQEIEGVHAAPAHAGRPVDVGEDPRRPRRRVLGIHWPTSVWRRGCAPAAGPRRRDPVLRAVRSPGSSRRRGRRPSRRPSGRPGLFPS